MFQLDTSLKRYILEFQALGSSVNPDHLFDEVDRVLLRLHPRITYKMGKTLKDGDGKFLIEIAVAGKRDLLEQAFKSHQWVLPVRFEKLTWGWTIENDHTELVNSGDAALKADPLAGVLPFDGVKELQLSKLLLWWRTIILMISTIVMVMLAIAIFVYSDSLALKWVSILAFAIWQFSLFNTPLDYRIYAHTIQIGEGGLELRFWPYVRRESLIGKTFGGWSMPTRCASYSASREKHVSCSVSASAARKSQSSCKPSCSALA